MGLHFKSRFQAVMWWTAIFSLALLIVFQLLAAFVGWEVFSVLRTTSLTVFYHFAVRLVIGEWLLMRIDIRRFDYRLPRFRVRRWEMSLYKALRVKKWKDKVPTYDPAEFSLEGRSPEDLLAATCRSETVHLSNCILSFVPLLFSMWFGAFWVFFATSAAAALFDLIFVILQRYNRPRLLKLLRLQQQKTGGVTHDRTN